MLCALLDFMLSSQMCLILKLLLVLLKSIVGQLQLKKGCSGTILTAINKEEFSKIAISKNQSRETG